MSAVRNATDALQLVIKGKHLFSLFNANVFCYIHTYNGFNANGKPQNKYKLIKMPCSNSSLSAMH